MRLPNWPKLLAISIEMAKEKPFVWGTHDCCLFAADCANAITGIDAAASLRGTYSNEGQATALVETNGGLASLVSSVCSGAGWLRITPKQAQRGDIVCYSENDSPALGICVGSQCAFLSPSGITFRPLTKCSTAWRVE